MARHRNQPEEEIPLSAAKNATQFLIESMAGVGGGLLGLWFATTVITTPNNGDMPRWLTVLLGWLCFLFSILLVGMGVFALVRTARVSWRRDRLILGETDLSCVARDGQVLTQIPYDNIREVRLLEDEGLHNGPPDDRVAIVVIDPRRKDTILRKESPLAPDLDEGDAVLRDTYRLTPRSLYGKLLKRWRNREQA